MNPSYIAVGSNLGDRHQNIRQAQKIVSAHPEINWLRSSEIYETEPVGGPPQGKYLNCVWQIETTLEPRMLLETLLSTENRLGRIRDKVNGPRTIDLDILFYSDLVCDESNLHIPHPRLQSRGFVLKPLMDLCPELIHPKLNKTIAELFRECRDFYPVA